MLDDGYRRARNLALAGVVAAFMFIPVSSWAQNAVDVAKREAIESIGTLLYHNRAEADRTLLAIARRLEGRGGLSNRVKEIIGIASLKSPKAQLNELKRHISWANAIDLGAWKTGTAKHKLTSRFKYRLAAQLEWVRVLLRFRGGLTKLRAGLPDPAAAAGGIRVIEWTEKNFFDAHDEKLIAPADYKAFLPVPLRAKRALCVLAKKKDRCWQS